MSVGIDQARDDRTAMTVTCFARGVARQQRLGIADIDDLLPVDGDSALREDAVLCIHRDNSAVDEQQIHGFFHGILLKAVVNHGLLKSHIIHRLAARIVLL